MNECGCNNGYNNGCGFDLNMILWVLIIIVIITCVCGE